MSINRDVQVGPIERMIFGQRPEGGKGMSHAAVWEKSFLGRRSSHRKDFYSKVTFSRNMKDANVPREEQTRRIAGDEFREAREERQIV